MVGEARYRSCHRYCGLLFQCLSARAALADAKRRCAMSLWAFLVAAVLLSLERLCYVWAWRSPESFRAFCDRRAVAAFGDPVTVLQKLFYCFKGIQGAVFVGWCY